MLSLLGTILGKFSLQQNISSKLAGAAIVFVAVCIVIGNFWVDLAFAVLMVFLGLAVFSGALGNFKKD